MEIVWLIAGVVLGGVAAWFMAKSRFASAGNSEQETINDYKTRLTLAEERKQMLEQEMLAIKPELTEERIARWAASVKASWPSVMASRHAGRE